MHPIAAMFLSPFRPFTALASLPSPRTAVPFYVAGAVAYASLPLLGRAVDRPWVAVALGVGMLALTSFFFVLGVDLSLDPRIQKGRTRGLIHRTLCTSGAFGLVGAAAVGAAASAGAGRPVVLGLLAATVWWQWMVEALGVRDLYEISYAPAFGIVALMRTLSTVIGGLIGFTLLKDVARVIEWGMGG